VSSRLASHFAGMARNNRWANYRLHRAIGQLRPGEFEAERTGFFPSIRATLNHILAIDRYYLDALVEGGVGPQAFHGFVPYDDASALSQAQAEQDQALIAYCEGLSAADLDRGVITDRGTRGRHVERIDDLLAHLFQHQIHHRGQVHAMLAGTSVKPPQLDEFFLVYDRADDIEEAMAARG
jgi:uncharacterized damage-inducible protein DinB